MAYSHAETANLHCPECGRDFTATLWLLIHLTEQPELLPQIHAGTIHTVPCPHCQHNLELDAPLLLYQTEANPPLIFSPAQGTSQEQDQEHLAGLVGLLRQQAGDGWQETWLEQLQVVPRPLLSAVLRGDSEAIQRELMAQTQQALTALAEEDPDVMQKLAEAAQQIAQNNPRLALLQQFIAADTWTASYRFAQEHPELLEDETDTLLANLTEGAANAGNTDANTLFNTHLILLRRSREIGLTAAFAEKMEITPEEMETASQMELFRNAARDILDELGLAEGETPDPEQLARLLAERPDLVARLPIPLADPSPEGTLSGLVFDFLLMDDERAVQMLQTEAPILTLDAGQMIDQFISAAQQAGNNDQATQWQERRAMWQKAYQARVGHPLHPVADTSQPRQVQPESWTERVEQQAVQAERGTQYTVISAYNSAIGDNALVINNIGILPLRWQRPAQGSSGLARNAVGREQELAELHQRLLAGQKAAVVSRGTSAALRGQPAIGKTTLAAMYVDRYGEQYPGGVFWLKVGSDLRTAEDVRPLLQGMAIYAYDRDVQAEQLLQNTVFAADRVKSLLSGHGHLLVVIDDVWDIAALRELQNALPNDAFTVLTTRDYHVAYALENSPVAIQTLGLLSPIDARLLLQTRAPGLPDSLADQVADGLGYHAHALSLAAGALDARKPYRYEQTATELLSRVKAGHGFGDLPRMDQTERLNELEIALKYSYDYLGEGEQGSVRQSWFRALGTFAQEADFDTAAAATLCHLDQPTTEEFLLLLDGLGLLQELKTGGRWQQHAILRAYALSLQTTTERMTFPERHADYYIDLARRCYESKPRDDERVEQEFAQIIHTFTWCEQHSPRRATRLTLLLNDFMRNRGRVPLLNQWLQIALHGAELHGDRLGKANTLISLGDLESRLGNVDAARQHYEAALPLYELEQARLGKANTLKSLGDLERRLGNVDAARQHYEAALPLYELEQARLGKANTLKSLGDLESRLGNVDAARQHYEAALPLYELEQARLGKANTLRSLGDLESRLGNVDAARQHYEAALPLYELEQARLGKANTLKSLGDLESRLGNVDAARQHYEAALPLYELEQARLGKANTLKSLGDLESRLGNVDAARQHYEAALPLYELEQARLGKANTLKSLGDLERRLGNVDAARQHYEAALPLYELEQARLGKANTLISLGDLESRLGNVDAARQHYEAALPLYELEQDRLGKANTLKSLGDLESRLGNVDAARQHYEAALPLYELEQDRLGKANTLKSLGDLESRLGNVDAARQHYEAALPLYELEQARLGKANTLKSLGDLERRLGNVDAARQHYEAALPLYELEQARLGKANTLRSLGDLESRLGNVDAARQHYEAALPLYELEQARLGKANTLKSLGDLESRLGNVDAARQHYEAALPLYELEQARLGKANTLKSLGDLERRLGNVDAARQHYEAALPLYELEQDRLGKANTLKSLGDLESRLGNVDAARQHYEAAHYLYELERDPMGLMNVWIGLARLEAEQGNIEQAKQLFQKVFTLAEQRGFGQHPVTLNLRQEYAQLIVPAPATTIPAEIQLLGDQLVAWIQTPDWQQSQAYLEQHPALLTEEAETVLALLQQGNLQNQAIPQHLVLLRRCREAGIPSAYQELQDALATIQQAAQDPQAQALAALLQVNSLEALTQVLGQHPVLLELPALSQLTTLAVSAHEAEQPDSARHLLARLVILLEQYNHTHAEQVDLTEQGQFVTLHETLLPVAASLDDDLASAVRRSLSWALNSLGNQYATQGDHATAIISYTQAISHAPANAMLYRNRAGEHLELGQIEEAEKDIEQAAQLEPDAPRLVQLRQTLAEQRQTSY